MTQNTFGASPLTQGPFGLTLKHSLTSGTSVTIPAGTNWVYAILVGGGGGGSTAGGGGGGVTQGWVPAVSTYSIGAGGSAGASSTNGGNTTYAGMIAGGGGAGRTAGGLA